MRFYIFLLLSGSGILANCQSRYILDSTKTILLNTPSEAEALPYLSSDGLRLYYTSSQEGDGRIYISQRKTTDDNFPRGNPLSKNLPDSFIGSTLTNDELEIYVSDAWHAYYSKRRTKNEDFPFPALIGDIGDCSRIRPAVSPNGEELIIVYDALCDTSLRGKGKDSIRLFARDKTGEFHRKGFLNFPRNCEAGVGQFSKDGLNYYTTVTQRWYDYDKGWQDSTIILKYSRASLSSDFGNYEIINPDFEGQKPKQITFNGDGTIMIGVRSSYWEWKKNDLIYYQKRKY
jgi:hypothetical protein